MLIQAKHNRNYSIICNRCLRDIDISAKAKGIFAYIVTLPHDWKLNKKELYNHFKEGRDALDGGFKELENKGYISKKRVKNVKGEFSGWEYFINNTDEEVSSEITPENDRVPENPLVGEKPDSLKTRQSENPHLSNTNELITKSIKSKDIGVDKSEKGTTTEVLIDDDLDFLFSEITKHKVFYKAPTDILKQARKFFMSGSDETITTFLRHYWEKTYKLNTGWNSGAWFVTDFLPEAHNSWEKQKENKKQEFVRITNLCARYKPEEHNFEEEYGRFAETADHPNDREILKSKNYKSIDEIDNPIIKTDFLKWIFA